MEKLAVHTFRVKRVVRVELKILLKHSLGKHTTRFNRK